MKEDGARKIHENGGECSFADRGDTGNNNVFEGESAQPIRNKQGEMIATHTVETGPETSMVNNIRTQQGGPEKNEDEGISIDLAGVTSETGSTASPMLPSYPVGRGVSLPFGQLLPKCETCCCSALIARTRRSGSSKKSGVLCLVHGLSETSLTECLVLKESKKSQYTFISPTHEAAIRAFFGS